MSKYNGRVSTVSLKSVKAKAASLVHSLNSGGAGSKILSVGTLLVEKIPSKDLEGDYQVSIWAHG